jgi:glucose-1-phosphate thymidylyltransferase
MEIAKALVLVGGGQDDRPWPTAPVEPKHLFPVANRPILFHNLEALRATGVREAVILAEPRAAGAIEQAVGDGRDLGLDVKHLEWGVNRSLGGALLTSCEFLDKEPLYVQQGDALLRGQMEPHLAAFARERLDTLAFKLEGGEPAPARAPRGLGPGYLLSPWAVSVLIANAADGANPLAGVRDRGGRVRVQRVFGSLPCHGDQQALLECNRQLLERIEPEYDSRLIEDSRIQGPVIVHPTARVQNSLLRGPAIIGPDVTICDAYVGPYTSLGAGVVIEGAEIEHSIVLAGAEIRFIGTRLESSIIGRRARISRSFASPAGMRMTVGDGVEVAYI